MGEKNPHLNNQPWYNKKAYFLVWMPHMHL